jgi:outer membrane lipoprotein-sorting protein
MKKIFLFISILFLSISCQKSGETLEGKLYNSGYVYIQFQMNGQYETFQKASREDYSRGCFGKGTWTYQGNKITLNPNDSECDFNRNVAGQYTLEGFKLSNSSNSYSSSYGD